MSNPILAALKIIDSVRCRKSIRFLDAIYGPRAAGVRAVVATMLKRDGLVQRSHKEAQYGRLRAALVTAIGATGNCIAAVDADFDAKAQAMLDRGPCDLCDGHGKLLTHSGDQTQLNRTLDCPRCQVAGLSQEDHEAWIDEAYGKPPQDRKECQVCDDVGLRFDNGGYCLCPKGAERRHEDKVTCKRCMGPLNPETGECSDLDCGVPKVSYERKR